MLGIPISKVLLAAEVCKGEELAGCGEANELWNPDPGFGGATGGPQPQLPDL